MKKIIFLIFVCLISSLSFAENESPKPSGIVFNKSESSITGGNFYPMSSQKYLILKFKYNAALEKMLKNKNSKQRQKVPIEYFVEAGLKEGLEIQFYEFASGKASKYKFKKSVNIFLNEDPWYGEAPDISYYGSIYILLSDSWEGIEDAKLEGGADNINGVAYIGNNYKLIDSMSPEEINYSSSPNESEWKPILSQYNKEFSKTEDFKAEEVKKGEYFGADFYIFTGRYLKHPGDTVSGVVMKGGDKYYNWLNSWFAGDKSRTETSFRIGKFIEKADYVILQPSGQMHECSKLLIFQNNQIFTYQLDCDSGGC